MNTQTETSKFKPTQLMINTCKAVFIAKANTQTVKEIAEPIQKNVLQLIGAVDIETGRPITEAKHSYGMNENQFREYLEEVHADYIKAGFAIKETYCPLLIAEDIERKAKRAFVVAMSEQKELTGITPDKLLCAGMDKYNEFIELSLRMMVRFIDKDNLVNV